MRWLQASTLSPKQFTCGHCVRSVGSNVGFRIDRSISVCVYICPNCNAPTYFDPNGSQFPGVIAGDSVENIPDTNVAELYRQARSTISVNSYTASVMCCRILLMHIAVEKGAGKGLSFWKYVEYLHENHFTPPGSEDWVDHIREKGNEANHEIVLASKDDALELLTFTSMLLKFVYEFPARMKAKKPL